MIIGLGVSATCVTFSNEYAADFILKIIQTFTEYNRPKFILLIYDFYTIIIQPDK